MSRTKHSFVAFYPSDWLGGTARMTRIVRSVYFDICLYNWEKAEPVPEAELFLMLADLEGAGENIVKQLAKTGKVTINDDGLIFNDKALDEGVKAFNLWKAKSDGGKAKKKKGEKPAPASNTLPKSDDDNIEESSDRTKNLELRDSSNEESDSPPSGEVVSPSENDPVEGEELPDLDVADRAKAGSIVVAWNEMARAHGLTQVAKMTGQRPSKLKARIRDHGVAAIVTGIDMIPKSPFLMGKNDRQWKANFDWLLRPDACTKLIEGGYHNDGDGVASAWRS